MTRPSGSWTIYQRSSTGPDFDRAHRVVLHQHRRFLAQLLIQLEVIAHKAQRLLDTPHRLEICCPLESVSAHEKELDEIAGDVSAGDVESTGEVRKGEAVVDGDDVGDTVSGIDDDTCLKS
jgi:hypothetical protein